jgi:cytochrome P450
MISLLSADYGTTATALVWSIFLMSKHSHVQNRLKKELSQCDQQHLSVEQLNSLVYLDCVILKELRFAPPTLGTLRTVMADD